MNIIYTYYIKVLFVLGVFSNLSYCVKILAVFPSFGYSQYILAEPLVIALAEKGHNVTVISGFETKGVKNLHNIIVNVSKGLNISPEKKFKRHDLSVYSNIIFLNEMGLRLTENILSVSKVQELIKSEEIFDVTIIETFADEALQAFGQHFNAHQVLFSSIGVSEWNSNFVGIPNNPSYLPNVYAGYTTYMNFCERFRNTMALWFDTIYKKMYVYPNHQKLVDKYFPRKYVLNHILYNASLMLTCSHVSTTQTVPVPRSVIEIGGLHVKVNKLSDSIQKFLDSAEHGAIFFSMGTIVKSSDMPKETIEAIWRVFKKLKQKVLWKFETENLENKPDNVMISKWFPQADILAHPNIVLFISHCGLGGTTEAIYHGVPVIGIPIHADQFMNIRKMIQYRMAVELPFKELSTKTLNDSIYEILNEPRYREAAKRRSKIFHDRPMKPLDEAIYWIEYVLRHDGAHHLKSSILSLSWYQLYLVDIIGLLLLGALFVGYISYALLRHIKQRVQNPKTKIH